MAAAQLEASKNGKALYINEEQEERSEREAKRRKEKKGF